MDMMDIILLSYEDRGFFSKKWGLRSKSNKTKPESTLCHPTTNQNKKNKPEFSGSKRKKKNKPTKKEEIECS